MKYIDRINGIQFSRLEKTGCYLCGKQYEPRRIPVAFGMYVMIAECPECRLAFQTPQPSPEASLAYMNWRWGSTDEYVASEKSQMRRARHQIRIVENQIGKPNRLLDFGAGAGSFVAAALDHGWDTVGIERSDSARERAKKYYNINLLETIADESFDTVTLWDVIEHLRDPIGTLKMIREHLVDGGQIFIETGNYENWSRVLQSDKWGLYLFDHQFYFTLTSLSEVLHRAGFDSFSLLDCNHIYPSLNPIRAIMNLKDMIKSWHEWLKARAMWPGYGDIDIMVAVGYYKKYS